MSDYLLSRGLWHPGSPVFPPLGACSKAHPLSQWCHPTNTSSFIPSSPCLQSFTASGSFLMSRLLEPGGLIGASGTASASVLLINIQNRFPLGLTVLISLQSKGLSSLLQDHNSQASILLYSMPSLWSNSHMYIWLQEKPYLWLYRVFRQSNISAF